MVQPVVVTPCYGAACCVSCGVQQVVVQYVIVLSIVAQPVMVAACCGSSLFVVKPFMVQPAVV